jgi:TolA-binding protein
MKRKIGILSVLAAAAMISAAPVRAGEGSRGTAGDQGQQMEKNECLLVAVNCGNQVDSIQQRIDRLEREIARGTDVYTNDELRSLTNQLRDAQKNLEGLDRDRS